MSSPGAIPGHGPFAATFHWFEPTPMAVAHQAVFGEQS